MVRITTADDLLQPNDVSNFRSRGLTAPKCHVAGISIACWPAGPRLDARGHLDANQFRENDAEVAQNVERVLLPALDKQVWVFIRTPWRPPSRISAYYKLWGQLAKQASSDLTGFELGAEVEFFRDNDVCYAGMMRLTTAGFTRVVEVLRKHGGFGLLSNRSELASAETIGFLLESAYSGNYDVDWQTLAEAVCPPGDIVLRVPPIMDNPPYEYESAIDLFLLSPIPASIRTAVAGD